MKRSKGYQMNIQLLNFLWKYPNVCWGNKEGFYLFQYFDAFSLSLSALRRCDLISLPSLLDNLWIFFFHSLKYETQKSQVKSVYENGS